jgi:Uma2 family endonuclease
MSTIVTRHVKERRLHAPVLANGDRMTQAEFHRRYLQAPEDAKFELIGGIVYMASPLSLGHSDYDGEAGFALELYRRGTPGVHVIHGATTILGEESEPQPDLGLRILPEYGGQSRTSKDNYVLGPPEMLMEVAFSTRAIDLHQKKSDYQRAGVVEYVVVCVEEAKIHWFDFASDRLVPANRAGVFRSRVVPGLWSDGRALLARDSSRITEIVQQGLASREHATFVRRLQAARRKNR